MIYLSAIMFCQIGKIKFGFQSLNFKPFMILSCLSLCQNRNAGKDDEHLPSVNVITRAERNLT